MEAVDFVKKYLDHDVVKHVNDLIENADITYLGEKEYIDKTNAFYIEGNLLLDGGTGIGKTTHVLENNFCNMSSKRHVNAVLPLVSLLKNKEPKHLDVKAHYGRGTNVYEGYTPDFDKFAVSPLLGQTTMGTPESLLNLGETNRRETLFFVDEIQYLIDAQGYRKTLAKAIEGTFDAGVFMSATMYREAILPFMDDYVIYKKEAQKRNVQIIIKGQGNHKTSIDLDFEIIKKMQHEDGFTVVLMEDKKHINSLQHTLLCSGFSDDEVITYVSPESDRTAKNTPRAIEMIETGVIPSGVKVLLWTSAALVGVDMEHEDGEKPLCVFDDVYKAQPEVIAQMAGRFRDEDEVDCIVFMSENAHERNFERKTTFDLGRAVNYLKTELYVAHKYYEMHGRRNSENHGYLLHKNGEVNTLGCMLFLQKQFVAFTNHLEIYERFNINLVDVVENEFDFETNFTEDKEEYENEILMGADLDMELIKEALADVSVEVPHDVDVFMKHSSSLNKNALVHFEQMNLAKHRYNIPHRSRYRMTKDGEIVMLAVATINDHAYSFMTTWIAHRDIRLELISDDWLNKNEVLKKLRACKGFSSDFEKKRFVMKVKKGKVRTAMEDIVMMKSR